MLILAIDTTGFSSSIALVENGKRVLFHKVNSSFVPNKNWRDFPYLLPARHQKFLISSLERLSRERRINWENIDAIAVSATSGIYNCILVGLSIAQILAYCYKKPLIKVDHILAHIYSAWLERDPDSFRFPILVFSASGSYSDFSLLKNVNHCQLLCDTIPQQFEKGAKIFIGIGKVFYQIGKKLEIIVPIDKDIEGALNKLINVMSQGDPHRFNFANYYKGSLFNLDFTDFMKDIGKIIKKEKNKREKLNEQVKKDIAASFQESITEILANKIIRLAEMKKINEIHITGGISENKYLKRKLNRKIKEKELSFILRYPVKKEYRLDNAAMIGALAYYQQKHNIKFINFKPNITY